MALQKREAHRHARSREGAAPSLSYRRLQILVGYGQKRFYIVSAPIAARPALTECNQTAAWHSMLLEIYTGVRPSGALGTPASSAMGGQYLSCPTASLAGLKPSYITSAL